MPLKLIGRATEKSSVGIRWSFRKLDGSLPEITGLSWTLTDLDGVVINSRSAVAVVVPSATETIVLSGLDLALSSQANAVEMRVLTIEATYDPENGGADLPIKESAEFPVYNLAAVT